LVCEEDEAMEEVRGDRGYARRSRLRDPRGAGQAGIAARVFGTLAEQGIVVERDRPDPGQGGRPHRHGVTVGRLDVDKTNVSGRKIGKQIGAGKVDHEEGIAKVSIVGVGMRKPRRRAAKMFQVLPTRA